LAGVSAPLLVFTESASAKFGVERKEVPTEPKIW
jgi:hypothetical protein